MQRFNKTWIIGAVLALVVVIVVIVLLVRDKDDDADPLELARNFSGDNADWEPVEQDFDGVTMVLVPAGCFMMGSTDAQIAYWVDERGADPDSVSGEQPAHRVCFDEPFWIDKYEVTNAQYGSVGCSDFSSDPDQPRNCVDWYEASAFCEARDARLPREAEWEYAARGPDALVYPWGNSFEADNVVYGANSDGQTAAVGSKPNGASWVGAMDMSGNVWEWAADWFSDDYYGTLDDSVVNPTGPGSGEYRMLRGGSCDNDNANNLRGADRSWDDPDYSYYYYGIRCARSIE